MYIRTNMGAGSYTEIVIFSDSATTTPGARDTTFTNYFVYNVEFSIKANLVAGKPLSISFFIFIPINYKLCFIILFIIPP